MYQWSLVDASTPSTSAQLSDAQLSAIRLALDVSTPTVTVPAEAIADDATLSISLLVRKLAGGVRLHMHCK